MRAPTLLLLALLNTPIFAQSNGFVSGTISYSSDGDGNAFEMVVGPALGINFSEQNVLGVALNMTNSTTGANGSAQRTTTVFEVAPFYRRMISVGDRCSVYGQFLVGYGSGSYRTDATFDDSDFDFTTLRVATSPGLFYNLSDRWALSAEWGLLQFQSLESEGVSNTELQLGVDLGSIGFSLNVLF
jgi:Outer membrane protein beta-barrel domain